MNAITSNTVLLLSPQAFILLLAADHQIRLQAVSVGFVVDKLAFGQVFLRILRFWPVTVATSVLVRLSPTPYNCSNSQSHQTTQECPMGLM